MTKDNKNKGDRDSFFWSKRINAVKNLFIPKEKKKKKSDKKKKKSCCQSFSSQGRLVLSPFREKRDPVYKK
jgi:hypothetical protein